ncbi:PKD domain-containing protein [Hyalangium minutum]|uniref:Fibronectin type-III domain-containing protein n=1 Tax=Hyalangium minutum TaxID=394096 RepID=A0A085WAE6_9BACT|nr:hypothetical protein [Hyalangium minutum]KFE64659.1 hypothetical protein DB31_1677 [Hyalangium minutum]
MSLWNSNRRAVSLAVTVLALGVLAACGGSGNPVTPDPNASAEIKAMLPQELAVSDVARVHVEARGPGIPTPVGMDLSLQGSTWQGTLLAIPAGLDRIFEAKAYDAAGLLLYAGQAGPITIASGSTVSVAILLQQVNPPPPYQNVPPTIDSVVVSANQVSPGGTITLTATAHDENAGDTITFAWTATAGSFSNPSASATSWVAPAAEGPQVLTLEVTDSKGTSARLSVNVSVQRPGASGDANVTVGFNTWPRVNQMRATPSILTLNVPVQLSVVASEPDGDALSYTWSANCPGRFEDSLVATPRFTLLSQPPPGPVFCTLTVTVSDGRGGQTTGSLSLLAGTPSQANVAPQIDSTFKSSEQAGGGEVVTMGLTAHDPESTPLTFSWTASQGSILATRGTSTASEVDWRAPACLNGPITVTAAIADAWGAVTHQQFSIAPRAGSSCGALTVSGMRNSYRVRPDGSTLTVPVNLSGVTLGAWVPSTDGASYTWRPGSGDASGTFIIPNVDRTPYLLRFGGSYLWAHSRMLDLSRADLGRHDTVIEPETTQLQMQVSGLNPWQGGDDFQLSSASTGLGYFSATSCSTPFFPEDLDGETSFNFTIDYLYSMQNCGTPAARIDASRGDVLYATQLVSRTDAATGMTFQEVQRSFQTNSLTGPNPSTLLLSGTLAPLPLVSRVVDYRAASFEALALAGHPSATAGTTTLNLGILPGYDQFGSYAGWPDLVLATFGAGLGDVAPTFTYGNPYPANWSQFITAQTTSRVRYSVPLEGGGSSTPRIYSAYTYAQQPVGNGPIIPLVGPPRDLRLNGALAWDVLTGVGETPLMSWTAPSLGTPTSYSVRVYELYATSTGSTSRVTVTNLATDQTQLRMPPGVLVPGKHYHLQVSALFEQGTDPGRPYMLRPVYHTAMAVTGRFQP